jgi:Na+/H+-dicarboxylate symporter
MFEMALLVPPVIILGLETPGIPGGAAYFMSPVIAALLHVPDRAQWVTTFVAVYSGLIPMFSTAGNTTDDGVAGAILEDRLFPVNVASQTIQDRQALTV